MVSISIPLSTPFIGPKFASAASPPPPVSVRFRPSLRVSAAYATTAERPTSTARKSHSLYEVLGIQMDANCQEIKSAYRRLARVLHPDVATNGGGKDASADEFIKIHAAYSTLSDPQKRADYDRTLFRQRRPVSSQFAMSPSASGFSDYTRRSWETDQCW